MFVWNFLCSSFRLLLLVLSLYTIMLHFVSMWQMAAEEQCGKMVSNVEMQMKQRCVTEFLHAEKMTPTDIHWHLLNVPPTDIRWYLLNIYGDQIVDVSTVRRWVVCFSSDDMDVKDKPRSRWPGTATKLRASPSAHLHKSANSDQGTAYRAQYLLKSVENNSDFGISQS